MILNTCSLWNKTHRLLFIHYKFILYIQIILSSSNNREGIAKFNNVWNMNFLHTQFSSRCIITSVISSWVRYPPEEYLNNSGNSYSFTSRYKLLVDRIQRMLLLQKSVALHHCAAVNCLPRHRRVQCSAALPFGFAFSTWIAFDLPATAVCKVSFHTSHTHTQSIDVLVS